MVIAAPEGRDFTKAERGELPSLSVVTLEDARPEEHKIALSSWLAEHDGHTGEAMTRDRIYRRPVAAMTSDAIAESLAATGRFQRVERVSSVEEAGTDLVMIGRLRRLRGWQAYRVEKDQPPRLLESLGDVFVDEIAIFERASGRTVFIGQTGAMLEEVPEELDPYAVAQSAFDEAVNALAALVATEDLRSPLAESVRMSSGDKGELEDLPGALPAGWSGLLRVSDRPRGWSGQTICKSLRAEDSTRWFFHPRLGFYRPSLELWLCPSGWTGSLTFEGEDGRFPATVVGINSHGEVLFAISLGKSSWPGADEDILSFLDLEPPGSNPVLVLPLDGEPTSMPSGLPADPERPAPISP